MEILIAKTAGFCFGVKRAVDMAFESAGGEHTYTFGPIIHNEVVIGELEQQGIKVIHTLQNSNEVNKLIIRSHGVSPQVYEESKMHNIEVIDATCPYVKKIHRLVEQYKQQGYTIIIAGDTQHPEIQGINGWGKNDCIIVKDAKMLEGLDLPINQHKYLVVAQTTYKKQVVEEIVRVLEEKRVNYKFINTICNATQQRQDEVVEIAKQVAVMLVIGSKNSSNSVKLFELSSKYCTNSYFISTVAEINSEWLEGCNKVGITAGASTPDSVINKVIEYIRQVSS